MAISVHGAIKAISSECHDLRLGPIGPVLARIDPLLLNPLQLTPGGIREPGDVRENGPAGSAGGAPQPVLVDSRFATERDVAVALRRLPAKAGIDARRNQ